MSILAGIVQSLERVLGRHVTEVGNLLSAYSSRLRSKAKEPIPVVDTYVPVEGNDWDAYMAQLRRDVLLPIRQLQANGQICWFSFLLHTHECLGGREEPSDKLYFHIRLQPTVTAAVLIKALPAHFQKPEQMTVFDIAGVDLACLRDQNWAQAWRVLGEAAELVFTVLESYDEMTANQLAQVLHYITNPFHMGHRCVMSSGPWISF